MLASQHEARIVLHCINSFPVGAIGPVTMFVTPPDDTVSDVRNVIVSIIINSVMLVRFGFGVIQLS